MNLQKRTLIKDGQWFQPRMAERKVYYFYEYVAQYISTCVGFEGVEALRRSAYDHRQYVKTREPGEAWIKPVMKAINVSRTKVPDRPSDLCKTPPSLVVSAKARDVLEPIAGTRTEFLPVEVEDGPDIYWISAPIFAEAFNRELSKVSGLDGVITSIDRPVLNGAEIPENQGFLTLDRNAFMPVFSSQIAAAIREHDLYGISMRQIEVV
ncbi:MAG: hypothetical protein P1U83_14490 [Roseovarius sp.]|jgi:hypothetical protein|nr:hypothetical protein [Roseovarius sp.]